MVDRRQRGHDAVAPGDQQPDQAANSTSGRSSFGRVKRFAVVPGLDAAGSGHRLLGLGTLDLCTSAGNACELLDVLRQVTMKMADRLLVVAGGEMRVSGWRCTPGQREAVVAQFLLQHLDALGRVAFVAAVDRIDDGDIRPGVTASAGAAGIT